MMDRDDQSLDAWLFAGAAGLMALCADPNGDPLPNEHGPWTRMRDVTLDHADEAEARQLIKEHGFCCFDLGADAA